LAMRHIWGAFQKEHPLRFAGEFYRFDLMSPFFDPGPIAQPAIAVYLAAVNEGMFRTAGEVADGIVAHPFSTASYLREIGMPSLTRGLARTGRRRADVTVACPVFTLVDASPTRAADEAFVRQQIAFYGSTPTYRTVLAHHGWAGVGEQLSVLVRRGRLTELPGLVTDAMLDEFVTRAPTYEELGRRLQERYRDILDRVGLYGDAVRMERSGVDALRRGIEASPTAGTKS
jgi:probable F420-dependent oxidoreductase